MLNSRDKENELTPVHFAIRQKRVDILRYLILKGSDVNLGDKYRMTPAHYATIDLYEDGIRELKKCLNLDLSKSDEYGRLPLHYACMNNQTIQIDTDIRIRCINVLSDGYSESFNKPDNDGYTPIQYLMMTLNDKELTEFLGTRGIDIAGIEDKGGYNLLH